MLILKYKTSLMLMCKKLVTIKSLVHSFKRMFFSTLCYLTMFQNNIPLVRGRTGLLSSLSFKNFFTMLTCNLSYKLNDQLYKYHKEY